MSAKANKSNKSITAITAIQGSLNGIRNEGIPITKRMNTFNKKNTRTSSTVFCNSNTHIISVPAKMSDKLMPPPVVLPPNVPVGNNTVPPDPITIPAKFIDSAQFSVTHVDRFCISAGVTSDINRSYCRFIFGEKITQYEWNNTIIADSISIYTPDSESGNENMFDLSYGTINFGNVINNCVVVNSITHDNGKYVVMLGAYCYEASGDLFVRIEICKIKLVFTMRTTDVANLTNRDSCISLNSGTIRNDVFNIKELRYFHL